MDKQEPPHWESAETIHRLGNLLHLPPEGVAGQDWEHECADADQLGEFFDLYEYGGLNDNEKHALMKLIVSSFDDYCRTPGGSAEARFTPRIELLLRQDFLIHLHTIRYWCCANVDDLDENPDYGFCITPLMRQIWLDCFKPEYQNWMKDYE